MLHRKAHVIHSYPKDFDLLHLTGVEVELSAKHSRQFEKNGSVECQRNGVELMKM